MSVTPHYLSTRENWQLVAQQGGSKAEKDTKDLILEYLENKYPGEYQVIKHPKDLNQMYYEYTYQKDPNMYIKPAEPGEEDVWFDAEKGYFMSVTKGGNETRASGGGSIPDIKIQHVTTGRIIFIECKNQNDAGNAHERAAKYATPSVISFVQKKLGVTYHPFGHVFTGAMVGSRKYVVELATTFGFSPNHLFLWKEGRPVEPFIEWLETVILPPLRD